MMIHHFDSVAITLPIFFRSLSFSVCSLQEEISCNFLQICKANNTDLNCCQKDIICRTVISLKGLQCSVMAALNNVLESPLISGLAYEISKVLHVKIIILNLYWPESHLSPPDKRTLRTLCGSASFWEKWKLIPL